MGARVEGFSGASIKDTGAKSRGGVEAGEGSGDGWGGGNEEG